ncbi:hypothetical protein CSUI_006677 [Cystoisospora suis]|uniref:Immune mapped protein 2 N-terminal domain-containing protein n=1 Tax=Cystoisospora suis TaxID=483139 RepID=A0A2C6KTA2_9APIC|nr:hypothetical protein CSUI_006677 [Cystoisospora suis]
MAQPVRESSDPFSRLLEVNVKPSTVEPNDQNSIPSPSSSSSSQQVSSSSSLSQKSLEGGDKGGEQDEVKGKQSEKKVKIPEDIEKESGEEKKDKNEKDGGGNMLKLPSTRRRRRSTVVGPDHAGCYLIFDKTQMKWVGQWSSSVLDDAVAFMLPKVKVPQFKFNKKEKVIFQTDRPGITAREERRDFLQGLCLFVKLTKEYQGSFLIISKQDLDERQLKLLGLGEKKELKSFTAEDVFYPASDLIAVAVLPASTISFSGKSMEIPIFAGLAEQEGGFAITFENR